MQIRNQDEVFTTQLSNLSIDLKVGCEVIRPICSNWIAWKDFSCVSIHSVAYSEILDIILNYSIFHILILFMIRRQMDYWKRSAILCQLWQKLRGWRNAIATQCWPNKGHKQCFLTEQQLCPEYLVKCMALEAIQIVNPKLGEWQTFA